jgi:ankyrin repeat protein
MANETFARGAERPGNRTLSYGKEPLFDSQTKRWQDSALLVAVRNRSVESALMAIDKGASIDTKDISGSTALMIAAESGDAAMCRALLCKGADIEARMINTDIGLGTCETALITSAKHGKKDVCILLLEKGADPNAKDRYKTTALMYAAQLGHPDVCTALLEHGADPRLKDVNLMTALQLSRNGASEAIQEYLAHFKV